jgi:glycosyltransferase involved in cell wall biosynthesis
MRSAGSTPPRILVVTKKMVTGGAERHLAQLLPALKARGFDVELFVLERGGELEAELTRADVTVSGPVRHSGRITHVLVAAAALYRRIRDTRPDILHFFLPEPYLVGAIVAIAARHRTCIMSRRSLAHYQRNHPWLGRTERILHRRMTALLGNSQAVVDELVAEAGDRKRIGLIHNGVTVSPVGSDDIRREQRLAFGIPPDAFVMTIVANLFHYKGHSDLLDALGSVAQLLPQPWRLVVIGRDEGEGPRLRSQAERLGIADRILWLGERRDVDMILSVADMGLLVSHQEGFSNALIEAMGQGLPMIATAVGGNLDAIVDGQSGRLVPPRDPASLGAAILELATNPPKRREIGLAARERVSAMFSQDACFSRYDRLYRDIEALDGRSVQSVIDRCDLSFTNLD